MSNYTIIRPKTREDWLKVREGGIGSSEVATILGLNEYETPYQLWRRKKGLDQPKPENFAMTAGHYLEDAVSRFYADATGREIIKASAGDWLIRNNERPFLQVSPDRTFWLPGQVRNDRNKGICECKTTRMDVDPDNLSNYWFCQLQYQLGVAELTEGSLAWLCLGLNYKFGYKDIKFDAEFFAYEVERVERFWQDYIAGDQEPPVSCIEDVMLRSPRHTPGKSIVATDEVLGECARLRSVKDEIAALTTEKKALEDAIKMTMDDAEALLAPNQDNAKKSPIIATWKAAKDSQKFDEKRFAAENPDLYANYLTAVPGSRRFLLK